MLPRALTADDNDEANFPRKRNRTEERSIFDRIVNVSGRFIGYDGREKSIGGKYPHVCDSGHCPARQRPVHAAVYEKNKMSVYGLKDYPEIGRMIPNTHTHHSQVDPLLLVGPVVHCRLTPLLCVCCVRLVIRFHFQPLHSTHDSGDNFLLIAQPRLTKKGLENFNAIFIIATHYRVLSTSSSSGVNLSIDGCRVAIIGIMLREWDKKRYRRLFSIQRFQKHNK